MQKNLTIWTILLKLIKLNRPVGLSNNDIERYNKAIRLYCTEIDLHTENVIEFGFYLKTVITGFEVEGRYKIKCAQYVYKFYYNSNFKVLKVKGFFGGNLAFRS